MKIITETVAYDVEFFVDGKFKHSGNDMLLIIEGLLESDGYLNVIRFNDKKTEKYFIKKKLAYKSISGSCASTEKMDKKLEKFYNKIYSMLYPNEEPPYK